MFRSPNAKYLVSAQQTLFGLICRYDVRPYIDSLASILEKDVSYTVEQFVEHMSELPSEMRTGTARATWSTIILVTLARHHTPLAFGENVKYLRISKSALLSLHTYISAMYSIKKHLFFNLNELADKDLSILKDCLKTVLYTYNTEPHVYSTCTFSDAFVKKVEATTDNITPLSREMFLCFFVWKSYREFTNFSYPEYTSLDVEAQASWYCLCGEAHKAPNMGILLRQFAETLKTVDIRKELEKFPMPQVDI